MKPSKVIFGLFQAAKAYRGKSIALGDMGWRKTQGKC